MSIFKGRRANSPDLMGYDTIVVGALMVVL